MRTLRTALLFCAVLTGGSAWALDLDFHVAGTFSADTGTTRYTAPNKTFSFDFVQPQQPEVIETNPSDHSFAVRPGAALTYHLNGSTFPDLFIGALIFNPKGGGLFEAFFSEFSEAGPFADFVLRGPQVFTGPLTTPTLLTGVFEIDPAKSAVSILDGNNVPGSLSSGTVTISPVPVPEAGSWILGATTAVAGWVLTRVTRRRRGRAL